MKTHFVILTGSSGTVLMRSKALSFAECEKIATMWRGTYPAPKYTVTIE